MKLEDLRPAIGSKKRRKRKARGFASGHGKTSCRGNNGQGQRSGGGVRPGFEGGQMPLYMRSNKKKYFHVAHRLNYGIVNVGDLCRYPAGTEITLNLLIKDRIVDKHSEALRILGNGTLDISLTIHADHFTQTAKQKIEEVGGKALVIEEA